MQEPKEKKWLRYRAMTICMLFMACIIVFAVAMFDAQIVHGAEYRAQSSRTNTVPETVEASRGIITDRNGKVLVSNRAVYTLTFDPSLVSKAGLDLNEELLRLIELLRREGVEWSDELPMSAYAPYRYDFSVARSGMLIKYLVSMKWIAEGTDTEGLRATTPAKEIFEKLREEFGVDPTLPQTQQRALVGLRYSLETAKLNGDGTFLFASGVDVALISLIKDGDHTGVKVGTSAAREYQTDAAPHILGHIGKIQNWNDYKDKEGYQWNDYVGIDGVEAAFEEYLRGKDGRRIVTSNAEGKVIDELYSVEPKPGYNVALTIDADFQSEVEDILARATEKMTEADGLSRGSAAAVVQVGTGDVLALASYPTFSRKTFNQDFAALNQDPLLPMLNRATMGLYPPGSTFKPVTAVAALETGVVTTQTKIRDLGVYKYYDLNLRCWIYPGNHGYVNVTNAITVSCNYFFYEVGKLTGISTLERYARAFGLGEPTGIEIAEYTGAMTSPEYVDSLRGQNWTDGLTLMASIGQAYDSFTPLQLASYTATLAGGGTRYKAHLLKDVSEYDSAVPVYIYDEPPVDVVSISDENLRAVLAGMRKLVTDGSVRNEFLSCVVDAAAKTGTAQTGGTNSNGVFIAFAPYDNPQIAVAVVIEKGDTGGALASTAVEILNAYFTAADPDVVGENTLLK